MLIVPAFSATSSPDGGEQQHDGGDRRVAVGALVGGDVAERVEEVAHRVTVLGRRGGERAAALADVEDGGRQQQRQHEQALHDVGDAAGHAGGAQEAGAGAQAAEDEGDEDRTSTRWRATSAASRPANPMPAPKLATSW